MNLKESFRFQNRLACLTEECLDVLDCRQNVVRVKETLLKKKVMPEAEDEVTETAPKCEYYGKITELVKLTLWLLDEREKLSAAIREAKRTMETDIDGESGLNSTRQRIAQTLRRMAQIKSEEETVRGGGSGLKFNAEGNQTTYRCDLRRVTTINFDRDAVRKRAVALSAKADAVSSEIDRCVIGTEVAYEAPFDVNETLSEVFERFTAN